MNFAYYIALGRGCKRLPIDEIDGVKVIVCIESEPGDGGRGDAHVRLEVTMINSLSHADVAHNQEEFEEMIDRLKNLKYNKIENRFDDGRKNKTIYNEEFYKCLESPTIKFSYEDCSVCLEKTCQKTKCGHHLCGMCASSLKKSRCPLCRKRIDYDDGDCSCCEDDDEDD